MKKAIAATLAAASLSIGTASAHGIAGKRFFPATPSTEDPVVADEFAFPTVTKFDGETELSSEFAKRLTRHFGVSVEGSWVSADEPGGRVKGFNNTEVSARWQFLTSAPHEAVMSLGVSAEIGGSGSERIGAEKTSVLTPALYFGKGFGDLPEGSEWLKPFAVTGSIGYERPFHHLDGDGEQLARSMVGGLAVEYSLPYRAANISGDMPEWMKHVVPLVEFVYSKPVANNPGEPFTATVNPGLIYVGRKMQIGAEAIIPANSASGDKVGFIVQLHFYIDDLFPHSIGAPLFGSGNRP